jgi:hypothetical protein
LPGYNPKSLAISAKGDRLAFAESTEKDLDIWRAGGPALTRLISSTHMDQSTIFAGR